MACTYDGENQWREFKRCMSMSMDKHNIAHFCVLQAGGMV
jgi:hypothetical protein